MKKKFILAPIICLSISMALISCNKGKGTGPEQPYGEKSGIITYKPMEMMGVKVTQ